MVAGFKEMIESGELSIATDCKLKMYIPGLHAHFFFALCIIKRLPNSLHF